YPEGERRLRAAGGEVPAFPSLRRAIFEARPNVGNTAAARELKVWVHRGHQGARLAGHPGPARAASRRGGPSLRARALPRAGRAAADPRPLEGRHHTAEGTRVMEHAAPARAVEQTTTLALEEKSKLVRSLRRFDMVFFTL